MTSDVIADCDANYWATMANLSEAVSGEAPVREDGLLLASCRSPISFFNSAFLLPDGKRSTAERLARAAEFFGEQRVPFVVRSRIALTPDLPDEARRLGLSESNRLPIMVLDPIPEAPPPPEGLRIEAVADENALSAHTEVVSRAFGIPLEVARQLFPTSVTAMPGTHLFVGLLDGEPASTSLVSITGRMAGIYNVATLESLRGRGLGEALTWWAVREGAAAGATAASLQASDMGRPVYERMGFRLTDSYLQFESG